MARRAQAAQLLMPAVTGLYRTVAGEETDVTMIYRSAWGGHLDPTVPVAEWEQRLVDALTAARSADLERGTTTVGPHRDEPSLLIAGRDARHRGSQGEQRAVALSLRLGLFNAVQDQTGQTPILVLDDVFSEFDPVRSRRLADALPSTQVFITTAHPEEVPVEGRWWQVGEGTVA